MRKVFSFIVGCLFAINLFGQGDMSISYGNPRISQTLSTNSPTAGQVLFTDGLVNYWGAAGGGSGGIATNDPVYLSSLTNITEVVLTNSWGWNRIDDHNIRLFIDTNDLVGVIEDQVNTNTFNISSLSTGKADQVDFDTLNLRVVTNELDIGILQTSKVSTNDTGRQLDWTGADIRINTATAENNPVTFKQLASALGSIDILYASTNVSTEVTNTLFYAAQPDLPTHSNATISVSSVTNTQVLARWVSEVGIGGTVRKGLADVQFNMRYSGGVGQKSLTVRPCVGVVQTDGAGNMTNNIPLCSGGGSVVLSDAWLEDDAPVDITTNYTLLPTDALAVRWEVVSTTGEVTWEFECGKDLVIAARLPMASSLADAGVTALNTLYGAITIQDGSNTSVRVDGQNIYIDSEAGGSGIDTNISYTFADGTTQSFDTVIARSGIVGDGSGLTGFPVTVWDNLTYTSVNPTEWQYTTNTFTEHDLSVNEFSITNVIGTPEGLVGVNVEVAVRSDDATKIATIMGSSDYQYNRVNVRSSLVNQYITGHGFIAITNPAMYYQSNLTGTLLAFNLCIQGYWTTASTTAGGTGGEGAASVTPYSIVYAPTVTVARADGPWQAFAPTNDVQINIESTSTNTIDSLRLDLRAWGNTITFSTNNVTYSEFTVSTNGTTSILYDSRWGESTWNVWELENP